MYIQILHSVVFLLGIHTHTHTALGWGGMECALRCDAVFFIYMNIPMYKMFENEDDDALTLSSTYCVLMHINLYWSLIGSIA